MTPMLLEDKIILVSGGTRGLGAGIARAAAADGAAAIMITGRDESAGKALAAELGNNGTDVGFQAVDLADPLSAAESVRATVASYGRIDCVVNSAGITTRGTLLDTTAELFDVHIAINLRGRRSSSCRRPCRICGVVRRPDRSSTSSPSPHTADSPI
jgi:NAD(P)-dependent dehydrogenase (short-subunit alcohol dehydrogenase family)